RVDISSDGNELVKQLLNSNDSLLFIPPRYMNEPFEIAPVPKDEGVFVGLFTSGTTSKPKCTWISRDKLLQNARISIDAFSIRSSHNLFILASPWHSAGLSWALMAEEAGASY